MYHVQFPGLGINLTLNPVAFRIGNHPIAWYGILIATGFLLAFLYAMASCKKFRVDPDRFVDVVMAGIIFGVIGARLYYVLFDTSDQFIREPIRALYVWEGGLGIYGGIIGGLLAGGLMAKFRGLSVPAVLDLGSLGFLIGQAVGRWGNFVNQEAFGTETGLPWRMVSENTAYVSSTGVHPCFLYESLWCVLGFLLLHSFSRRFRRYDGQVFLLYLLWYGAGRFFIEGLRTDSLITPVVPLRVSQVVAAASVAAAAILLVVFRGRTSLTGCGSPAVMELNDLVDEVAPEEIVGDDEGGDGASTIFASPDPAKQALERETGGKDPAPETAADPEPDDEPSGSAPASGSPVPEAASPESGEAESEENENGKTH